MTLRRELDRFYATGRGDGLSAADPDPFFASRDNKYLRWAYEAGYRDGVAHRTLIATRANMIGNSKRDAMISTMTEPTVDDYLAELTAQHAILNLTPVLDWDTIPPVCTGWRAFGHRKDGSIINSTAPTALEALANIEPGGTT